MLVVYFTASVVGAMLLWGRDFGLGFFIPYAILVPIFFTKNHPLLFEVGTCTFFAFSIFILGFVGPTSIA